jgi:hypothetical protein
MSQNAMKDLLPLLLSTDWLALIGALTSACASLVVLFSLIPGEQPEKAIKSFANFIGKFSRK